MSAAEILAILPVLWVGGAVVVLLPLAAFHRSSRLALGVALVGLAGGVISLFVAAGVAPRNVTSLLVVDPFALFFQGLCMVASAAVAVLARDQLERLGVIRVEELLALLLMSTVGAMVLVATRHFAAFFLGLETLSVGLYGMVAYLHDQDRGLEAGIKYLVLAGASSGFLLFGIALLYLEWGTLSLAELPAGSLTGGWSPVILSGAALLTVGLGFKLALVPFHLWTPDVYQAAPAPVTAFLATVSKGAVLAFLLRLAATLPGFRESPLWLGLAGLAVASMIAGNLLALLQNDVKRILAYSSIAHLGYLMVPVLAGGREGIPATGFYLVAYFATTLAAFGVIGALGDEEGEGGSLDALRALWWRRPLPAVVLSVALLSLAGLPFTAGFVGKFYLLAAGVDQSLWVLAFVLAGTSVIGLFYYLRVMAALFTTAEAGAEVEGLPFAGPEEERSSAAGPEAVGSDRAGVAVRAPEGAVETEWYGGRGWPMAAGWSTGLVLTLLLLLVIGVGVWPGPLFELVRGGVGLFILGG